jgi:hypothetical protein
MERCFQLLAFGVIQFLDLPKANKENDEMLETNTLLIYLEKLTLSSDMYGEHSQEVVCL